MEMKGLYFTLVAAQESSQEVEAEEMEQMEEEQQKRLSEHSIALNLKPIEWPKKRKKRRAV